MYASALGPVRSAYGSNGTVQARDVIPHTGPVSFPVFQQEQSLPESPPQKMSTTKMALIAVGVAGAGILFYMAMK